MAEKKDLPPGDEPEIADATHLFRDEPEARTPSPGPARPSAAPEPGGYELEGGDPPVDEAPAPPVAVPPPAPRPRPTPAPERRARLEPDEEAQVEQVWSRGAEWGPNLLLLAIVGLVVALIVYQTFSFDDMTLAFALLMAGGATLLVLSYPIVITLERPVRITPEQAVKDFYGALSHHVPHYRRMWLLLSSAGRTSASYASFEGFKAYWKKRLAQLKGDRAGRHTPLVFKVEDFKSDKSAGKTALVAKFTVQVYVRGRQAEGPLESIRVEAGLVKGPDKMWYLNQGTLPGGRVL